MLTTTYIVYLLTVICITVFVARTLSQNGVAFLIDGFDGDEKLAASINHLLVVGFYLINLGFALLQMGSQKDIVSIDKALVFLSSKIGFVMMVLGLMHMLNLWIISRFKQGHLKRTMQNNALLQIDNRGDI